MNKDYEKLAGRIEKMAALQTALALFGWDAETAAPEDSLTLTSRVVGELSSQYFDAMVNEEVKELLQKLKMRFIELL